MNFKKSSRGQEEFVVHSEKQIIKNYLKKNISTSAGGKKKTHLTL